MSNIIKISVRSLVEFVMQQGDLDLRMMSSNRAVEGTRIHKKIQSQGGEEYTPEVSLSYTYQSENLLLQISGRADGIIKNIGRIIIDEIKSTTVNLENLHENYNMLHWAQAKGYAYIYAKENNLSEIDVQLTYCNVESREIKRFIKTFDINTLEKDFFHLIYEYIKWAKYIDEWVTERNESIKKMKFPFDKFRKGQRELSVSVYTTLKEEKKLFIKAPTGIGKTMGTIFPSIKYLGESGIDRIFYLTAKTIGRSVAEGAINKLRNQNLRLKSITLTAKDKICPNVEANCNPEECKYAKGYYDKLKIVIADIFSNEDEFTKEKITEYTLKYEICPFEFSLDLSLWCDCIICDYNYVFDPRVYLRRFFIDAKENYTFLIDEAHNLVDRSREMFSASINKQPALELKRKTKEDYPALSRNLNKINSLMISYKKKAEESGGVFIQKEEPLDLYLVMYRFKEEMDEIIAQNEKVEYIDELMEYYFKALGIIRTYDMYDENYVTYYEVINSDLKVRLFCLDPSMLLKQQMKKSKSNIIFSATLNPLEYFMKILGGDESDYRLCLESPFKKENLCLMINNSISTTYKDRESTILELTACIKNTILSSKGNYMIFFPSYKYMMDVLEILECDLIKNKDVKMLVQSPVMTEEEREKFLQEFKEGLDYSVLGFVVMGGIFGEGIDLVGDKLTGAVVVGVGLPQICFERELIKEFFDNKGLSGFNYSYMYPGMNRVMQAVGRVIRTDNDKGIVLLIDKRFLYRDYLNIFPNEWSNFKKISNYKEAQSNIYEFWGNK